MFTPSRALLMNRVNSNWLRTYEDACAVEELITKTRYTYLLCAGPPKVYRIRIRIAATCTETLICMHWEKERERDYTRETKEFPARQFAPDRWYRDGWTRDEPAFVSNRIFFVSFFRFFTACSNRIETSLLEAALRFNTNATADWDRLTGFPRQSTREPKLSCRRRPL